MGAARNLVVAQSGGPTPVINSSLRGIIEAAREFPAIGTVYGARHGIEGRPGFVIGDDLVAGFPSWKNVKELVNIVDIIVARRTLERPPAMNYPHRVITNTVLPISSSEIRRRIREGRAVRYLLPDAVLAYIRDNNLYG